MPEQNPDPSKPINMLADILAQFFHAVREAFIPAAPDSIEYRRRIREEWDEKETAEAAIKRKYANSLFQTEDIRRRAAEHGVIFSVLATHAHRAAILDFLDNPNAPTPLHAMHMTWFWGATVDGKTTVSRTHPVNRAVYNWNARNFAASRPYGNAHADASLHRLRSVHFPLERCSWTTDQWVAHEKASIDSFVAAHARPLVHAISKQRDGIPVSM